MTISWNFFKIPISVQKHIAPFENIYLSTKDKSFVENIIVFEKSNLTCIQDI